MSGIHVLALHRSAYHFYHLLSLTVRIDDYSRPCLTHHPFQSLEVDACVVKVPSTTSIRKHYHGEGRQRQVPRICDTLRNNQSPITFWRWYGRNKELNGNTSDRYNHGLRTQMINNVDVSKTIVPYSGFRINLTSIFETQIQQSYPRHHGCTNFD